MQAAADNYAPIHAIIDTSPHDPAVRQLRPIAGTHDARIARAHVKLAVGIAAERELHSEPIHRGLGLFCSQKRVESGGDPRLDRYTVTRRISSCKSPVPH